LDTNVSERDKNLVEKFAKGSSYMSSMEDLIKLQKEMRGTPINNITVVPKEDTLSTEKTIAYVLPSLLE
jgi:hypothetical protein